MGLVWSWGGVGGEKLPRGLEMFGREGLKRRWGKVAEGGMGGDGVGGNGEGRAGEMRGWDGEGEMGMGFGDMGGFDNIDYDVPLPFFPPQSAHISLLLLPPSWTISYVHLHLPSFSSCLAPLKSSRQIHLKPKFL
jgi:hypothetical protein